MEVLNYLKIKEQVMTEKEKCFVKFLENKCEYKQNFRFLFVYTKINKENLYSMFDGLLKDVLVIGCEKYSIIVYHSKERVILNNYLDALSEDFGFKINVFEGFLVNKELTENFKKFILIYEKYYKNNYIYSSVSNLILNNDLNKEELNLIKKLLLSKFLKDVQFEKFIIALFENNLNVSKTAKDIYMHRNTVNNKLANFENDTTLILQNFKDAIVVYQLLK